VDFGLWGGATPDNIDDLESLHRGGVLGFKAFMSNSGIDEFSHINDGDLLEIFQRLGKWNQILSLHAENDSITACLAEKFKSSGRVDRKAWLESRPPFVEQEAVNRALFLAGYSRPGIALHFVHTTVASSIQAIAEARRKGLKVTVETCPHYLTLTERDFVKLGPVAKCAPPLRNEQEAEALWECLRNGLVDTIGSDHSPCTLELKAKGEKNIWKAWGGISGIQTMLPVMYSEGVVKRGLAPSRLVSMLSYNPAKLFGLYPRKGLLQPGSDADVVLFDPNKKWVIRKENLLYKNKHSPFVGKKVTGSVEMTILRGKIIYRNGDITAPPGTGRFLSRQSFSQTRTTR
jgi:allantoinase